MSASDPVYKEISDHCHAWPGLARGKESVQNKQKLNRIHGDAGIHGFGLILTKTLRDITCTESVFTRDGGVLQTSILV
jgi:hypothetical protein